MSALNSHLLAGTVGIVIASGPASRADDPAPAGPWEVGTPIVTYWAGPGYPGGAALDDAAAAQLVEGGWNLVWCHENELEVARRHGVRGMLTDPLLTPDSLDDPSRLELLDSLIARVQGHPGLYAYHLVDEPNAAQFPALGRLVAHLRERDPAHLAYINLFPTYASNEQLGTRGDRVTAYQEHLRRYVDTVNPALISYDHYQFGADGDRDQYFLNLDLIRRAAQQAGVPFLNIVQACTWTPSMRIPGPDEMRYLVYTTLAYGAQGISYYVYSYPGHTGAIALADGTPTPLYHTLKLLNREFAAVAAQLQTLRPAGVYHAGMAPPGSEPLPADLAFALEPPVPTAEYRPLEPVKGVLLGCYGPQGTPGADASPTHVLVVNLDYAADAVVGVRGPALIERFDAVTGGWAPVRDTRAELHLPRGGGALLRVRPEPTAPPAQ